VEFSKRDEEIDRLSWSDDMVRLPGLEPEAIVPTPDFVIARTHPDDRRLVAAAVAAARVDWGN
jgi:hypothetical protein